MHGNVENKTANSLIMYIYWLASHNTTDAEGSNCVVNEEIHHGI